MFASTTNSITFFKSGAEFAEACVVIFSYYGLKTLGGKAGGTDFLLQAGYDVVSIQSNCDDWHQGLPLDEVEKLACFLREHYRSVHGYGSSMGAYAAIAFSGILGFSQVLAMSPQFRIDLDYDQRWRSLAQRIEWRYVINDRAGAARYFMVYDPLNTDSLHIPLIAEKLPLAKMELLPIRYSGHPCNFWLHDAGLLKPLVLTILEGGHANIDWRTARKGNPAHLRELGIALFHRGRYSWCALVLKKAVDGGAVGAQLHKMLSGAQAQSGNMSAAIVNARLATDMAASAKEKAGCLVHWGHMLHRMGNKSEAITRFDEAIALMPANASYRVFREKVA